MNDIEVSRVVAAPVERVWEVFTDLGRAAERMSGVESIQVVTPGPFKVGTTWRETRRLHGKSSTEQLTVTECDPPTRYVAEAESKGTHYRSEFTFTPDGPGRTEVRAVFGAQSRNPVGKVVGVVLGGLVSRTLAGTMDRDLADLADFCESSTTR